MSNKNRFISCKGATLGLIGTFAAIMTASLPLSDRTYCEDKMCKNYLCHNRIM